MLPRIGPDGTIEEERDSEEDARFYQSWQPTSQPTGKDAEESLKVARSVRALPKSCWLNARKVILRLDEYAEAIYVEGFTIALGLMPIEHGWVVRGGLIIDPTLPESPYPYFPGLEFRGRAGIAEFLASPKARGLERKPFLCAFGFAGCKSPSFTQARARADHYLWPPPPVGP